MCFVFINTYIWSFIALSLSVSSLNWNSDPNTEKCAFSLPTAALKWQFCHCGWSIYKWGQLNSIISCLFWQSLGKNDTDSFLVEGTWIWMPGLFLQQQSPLVMSNEGCLPSANEGNESWWSCLLWQKGKGKRKKGNLPGATGTHCSPSLFVHFQKTTEMVPQSAFSTFYYPSKFSWKTSVLKAPTCIELQI